MGKEIIPRQKLAEYIGSQISHYTRDFSPEPTNRPSTKPIMIRTILDLHYAKTINRLLVLTGEVDGSGEPRVIRVMNGASLSKEVAIDFYDAKRAEDRKRPEEPRRSTQEIVRDLISEHKIIDKLAVTRLSFSPQVYVLAGFCEKIFYKIYYWHGKAAATSIASGQYL